MRATSDVSHAVSAALATALEESQLGLDGGAMSRKAIKIAGLFLADTLRQRTGDEPIVRIDSSADGAGLCAEPGRRRMSIAVINSDMPFLVDSVSGCIAQAGLSVHVLAHPVLPVRRDAEGRIGGIGDGAAAKDESIIYIEADHADAAARKALEGALLHTLRHVRGAVADWPETLAALTGDADHLGEGEGGALLRWFADNRLTLLGHEIRRRDGMTIARSGICRVDDDPILGPESMAAAFAAFDAGQPAPLVLKSNRQSRVHRQVLLDLLVLPVREDGAITALSLHAGLWTSAALAAPPSSVPVLRRVQHRLMARYGFDPAGHAGKALAHALTYLPHDVMLCLSDPDRERLTLTAMSLNDRPRPQLALASDTLDRHLFAFVWLPRDDLSTTRREAIGALLGDAASAPLLGWSMALDESGVALLRFVFDLRDGGFVPDAGTLDARIKEMLRGWAPALEAALAGQVDPAHAADLAARYAAGFPIAYRDEAGAREAAVDTLRLTGLAGRGCRSARLYRHESDAAGQLRLKLYSLTPLTLSEAVPALENFGFRVVEELSTPVGVNGALGHIQRFILMPDRVEAVDSTLAQVDMVEGAIAAVLEGRAENDHFNALLMLAGVDASAVVLLRAIFRYLRQTGASYGLLTVVEALRRSPSVTAALIGLFRMLHDPARAKGGTEDAGAVDSAIDEGLAAVSAIDEDRILRLYRAFIHAVLRTNAFAQAGEGALAFKIDSGAVPGLPKPVPWREIWVYSPRVEGIHLRAGPIARGGLRWSDRRDDFRTEILGLMKAQRVKNAVIVPTGAKGGFYPKQLPDPARDREAWLREGTESYRVFIRALLSVTDNVVKAKVRHPKDIVVRDGEDPYFVVAADKGTASFSDIANAIATEQGFWLGDAFASGGSNGYDHKAMGITARGAWVSVQRHFREMGVDVQTDPVTVIGVGDMSGDVFGNGMLLSKSIRLRAAFDHRHIFVDPDPTDPAASHAERQRLFGLPRSSWDDYDRSLISAGGGVFPRAMKTIPLSDAMRSLVGTDADAMEPAQFISALLTAPVDLLWFGGIGTYVKAAAEANSVVGDTANDRLRVDAEALRAKVIGEGANLGVTQAARIAFAMGGGRINTDFIDNSAGVDCSDNEVNIKIALDKDVAEGNLGQDRRNALLREMTGSVAAIVLEDNRLQALGLSIAEAGGPADMPNYLRMIRALETAGKLDRHVEGLAADADLVRRAKDGKGLTRPELAVLSATVKLTVQEAIENSPLAADPALHDDLALAFPPEMRASHGDAIAHHQLRHAIVATKLANRIVNRLGMLLPFALYEGEGESLTGIAAACVTAERLLDLPALWRDLEVADMAEAARIAAFQAAAEAAIVHVAELCRLMAGDIGPDAMVARLSTGVALLSKAQQDMMTTVARRDAAGQAQALGEIGVPDALASRIAALRQLNGASAIADMARGSDLDPVDLAQASQTLAEALGLDWVQGAIAAHDPADPWEAMLLSGVARELRQLRLDFLAEPGDLALADHVAHWLTAKNEAVARYRALVERARTEAFSPAMAAELAARARQLLGQR